MIIEKMTKLVEKHVKHYKTDFYVHDMETLKDAGNKKYIWILRDSGTWLFEKELASATYDYCLNIDHSVIGFYELDFSKDTIKKIKNPEQLKHFTVTYKNSNNVFMNRKMRIDSWNKETCEKLARLYMPEHYDYFEIA